MDGAALSYGLNGRRFPKWARIIGVADTLDDHDHNRPYQTAMDLGLVRRIIKALAGSKSMMNRLSSRSNPSFVKPANSAFTPSNSKYTLSY